MENGDLSVNLIKKAAAYFKGCDKTVCSRLNFKGIKYGKNLTADTVHIESNAQRWSKALNNKPDTFSGSAVSMHHELSGQNHYVRKTLEDVYSGKAGEKPVFLKEIYKTDKEFAKLPPLEKDCIVYRGRTKHPLFESNNKDFDIIENAKPGDKIVPDLGYSYTAFEESVAGHWHDESAGGGLMYIIRLPKGAKVSRNLEHGGEVVMPRGAEYKLISKEVDSNGNLKVLMEYVMPEKNNLAEAEKLCNCTTN